MVNPGSTIYLVAKNPKNKNKCWTVQNLDPDLDDSWLCSKYSEW